MLALQSYVVQIETEVERLAGAHKALSRSAMTAGNLNLERLAPGNTIRATGKLSCQRPKEPPAQAAGQGCQQNQPKICGSRANPTFC